MPDSSSSGDSNNGSEPTSPVSPTHSSPLRVAVVQLLCDKSAESTLVNLSRMRDFVRQGAAQGVQLMVFPELGTCGYDIPAEQVVHATESAHIVLDEMAAAAREANMRIVFSYPSLAQDGEQRHISASSMSSLGHVEITYHKTHPWAASAFENAYFALGTHFCKSVPLYPHLASETYADGEPDPDLTDSWLNVLICWDIEFPEPLRTVRLATPGKHHHSALVACVPTANADASIHAHTLRTRAAENHCFVLYANHAGPDFSGGSAVVGPDGRVLAMAKSLEEEMVTCEIDVRADAYRETRRLNPMLEWRRPELYGPMCEPEQWEKPSSWGSAA